MSGRGVIFKGLAAGSWGAYVTTSMTFGDKAFDLGEFELILAPHFMLVCSRSPMMR